jgi:hypothetical protein
MQQSTLKGRREDKQSSTAMSKGDDEGCRQELRHRRMRGDDGNNKTLPQRSSVGSDKRCSGDSGVVMMAAVAEDGGGGQQRRQWMKTVVDNNVVDNNCMQDWVAD